MIELYNYFLYHPILWLLVEIYNTVAFHDLGIAIILLTILVRVVLLPLFYKGAKDQVIMQRLQPKIKEIQETHRENKERQARELMSLYREHRVNPLSSILLVAIQLPILIALYQVFGKEALSATFDNLSFLSLINLGEKSVALVAIAAILQYIQGKLALPKQSPADGPNPVAAIGKTMVYVGPLLTLVILVNLPSALGLYWAISTAFSVIQQIYINKHVHIQITPTTNEKTI
ncbi:MAG: YidC/Oxa1 family membrane protein insertase [Candidatus Jorgensenbacteria bacterium]|nr:YidC/Oxa1 family membrane protein insertase [Candidatus Jorgensenbacteria bacterium]